MLKFQQECFLRKILVSFTLMKSSLVTQGRNLCVAEMLNHADKYTHLLFIDSDIDFQGKTIFWVEFNLKINRCRSIIISYKAVSIWHFNI